jgi:phosphoesterase RecJ-like protein
MIFNVDQLKEISECIQNARYIAITTHRNPDGDAMGSTLGLFHFLKSKFTCEVCIALPDPAPEYLDFLPAYASAINFKEQPVECSELLQKCDVLFCLDFNNPARTADLEPLVADTAKRACSIMLDHHPQPIDFVNYMGSDTTASSTCELVYRFSCQLGMNEIPSTEMAECIYTGIMTDTGSFRFSVTRPETHYIASCLLKAGIRHWEIHEKIFNRNSLTKLKLWGYALSSKLDWLPDYNSAIIVLSADELNEYRYEEGDLEGLVNYALSISGVKMGVLMSERNNQIRISFRSVGDFSVNKFARDNFDGGGHVNAAGAVYNGSLQDAKSYLYQKIKSCEELR